MNIRQYMPSDCNEITELFYNTVHSINAKDYAEAQLNAWASGKINIDDWNHSLLSHYSVICEKKGIIIGFGDIDGTGYLDRLYVHKNYQGIGAGSAIVSDLEDYALKNKQNTITTHASITAKPFFQNRGYTIINEQQVKRDNQLLTNFIMIKQL